MENKEKEHFLTLKVMRLTRPSLYTTLPVTSDLADLTFSQLNTAVHMDIGVPENLVNFSCGNLLMLPQSFGNIYLGETFSCYMSVHNDSQTTVRNVSVQADLQIGLQRHMLMGHNNSSKLIIELKPDKSFDDVIHHEVKEIGTHILACTVSYSTENEEKMHFRKFFKFQVSKPLDVKTKFYNAEDYVSDEVYLEAQLQNLTSSPMCLEKVALEPSVNFTSRQLNTLEDEDGVHPVFGSVNCLNPLDSRQYLFCLTPKCEMQGSGKILKGVTSIGKLDIVWRSSMGERGRLQTSQLERMAPSYGDIRVTVEEIPSIVALEKPFSINCRVTNTCERSIHLLLTLINSEKNGIIWNGISGRHLDTLEPHSSMTLRLDGVPIKTGLLMISGIRLTDTFLKRTHDYDDLAQIFVRSHALLS